MKDVNFTVKSLSRDNVSGLWSGSVEFERHFDNGNVQSVCVDLIDLSGPKEASEQNMRDVLLEKAKTEARRAH